MALNTPETRAQAQQHNHRKPPATVKAGPPPHINVVASSIGHMINEGTPYERFVPQGEEGVSVAEMHTPSSTPSMEERLVVMEKSISQLSEIVGHLAGAVECIINTNKAAHVEVREQALSIHNEGEHEVSVRSEEYHRLMEYADVCHLSLATAVASSASKQVFELTIETFIVKWGLEKLKDAYLVEALALLVFYSGEKPNMAMFVANFDSIVSATVKPQK